MAGEQIEEAAARVAVIVPALNEAHHVGAAVASAWAAGADEVIVVDGGSSDGTPEIAAACATCIAAPAGRAAQMNAGAAFATAEVLLFLHADSTLEPGACGAIRRLLADETIVGGFLIQSIDAPGLSYRVLERGNCLRARLLGWAYGDQGIFVRRGIFEEIGGFPALPLMEDLYFMKSLRRRGRVRKAAAKTVTSARRWQRRGLVRQTLLNWTLVALAHVGVPLGLLARLYGVRDASTAKRDSCIS